MVDLRKAVRSIPDSTAPEGDTTSDGCRRCVEKPTVSLHFPGTKACRPVVVIAHGFAGSRQMMQAYAVTLARNGYLAVTFDFPGHGRNSTPSMAS
ncbi:alpha/beta fold hydrolase [Thiocapsa sp.]|nr:alpha/beta fold hydrolase [Thiocapsa sp.]